MVPPRDGLGGQIAGQLQVSLHGLGARSLPAGGQPVGGGEHSHLELHRLARTHVAVHVPAIQRALVHEEAEAQMMLRQRRGVVGQRGAAVQPPHDVARHAGADAVVTPEQHPALRGDGPRGRLAGVVQQRSQAQGLPARELVRQRTVQLRADALSQRTEHGVRLTLDLDEPLEHLERVPPHVKVVVRVLLHSLQAVQLREQMGEQAGAVGQADTAHRVIAPEQAAQLVERALRCDRADAVGGAAGERLGGGFHVEAQLAGEAGQAQDPQRVVLEGLLGHGPQETLRHVRLPAVRDRQGCRSPRAAGPWR